MWGCAVLAGLLVLCSPTAAVPGLCMLTWSCVLLFFPVRLSARGRKHVNTFGTVLALERTSRSLSTEADREGEKIAGRRTWLPSAAANIFSFECFTKTRDAFAARERLWSAIPSLGQLHGMGLLAGAS